MGRRLSVGAGLLVLSLGVADGLYRCRMWGRTVRDARLRLPGDDLVSEPARSITRAVIVRAPVDLVGQRVDEFARRRGGRTLSAGRSALLADSPGPFGSIRSLHVLPIDVPGAIDVPGSGPRSGDRCRLILRSRSRGSGRIVGAISVALAPFDLWTTRRLLTALKDGAERASGWTVTAA